MKKRSYLWMFGLILSVMTLGFSSCSDDEDGPGSSEDLIGTWQSVSIIDWEKKDGEIVYGSEEEQEDYDLKIIFDEDGSCKSYERRSNKWYLNDEGTWKYKGGKIYTYDEDGELLDDGIPATVKKLTSSELIIEYYEKETEDGICYEYYEKVVFQKISD